MNLQIKQRINKLQDAIDRWLSPGNDHLREAIDRSVKEGFFSFPDIKYQIQALKKSIKRGELIRWAEQANHTEWISEKKKVLCLHAGNLPLVGVQDILAVALSGHHYIGKISRKDPYLPQTLLNSLKNDGLISGRWSVELPDLKGERADALLFSGSVHSVDDLLEKLSELDIADNKTPQLMRTAHFSIACIEDNSSETMHHLADAVFRYGGKGCRSVAMVVAPFSLNSSKCEFTDYVESFWLKNPQHEKPSGSLYYRYAYNKAAGIEQAWLDDFLIEETEHEPTEPFILHWVQGDRNKAAELANKYRQRLQTVYVTDPSAKIENAPVEPELMRDAQNPPIWWKPDGQDPLKWLIELK